MKHSLGSPGTDFHRTVDPQLMIRSWKAYDLVHLKSKRIQLVTMRMVHNSFEKYSKNGMRVFIWFRTEFAVHRS